MSATLKLAQLNIEGSKHINLVIPFLQAQNPDVVCIQELKEQDIETFEKELKMRHILARMHTGAAGVNSIGIFTALPLGNPQAYWYGGQTDTELAEYVHSEHDRKLSHDSSKFYLLTADIEKEKEIFHVGTTHFPVTAHGEATDYQREDMARLLLQLEEEGEFVLAGDFNAPRGGEIFAQLAEKYKDNIPLQITTSIDGSLHRAGQLPHMVDGIFSTAGYKVMNVQGHTGVSDHWAFTADVVRTRK